MSNAVRARYGELELSRFIGELIRTLMSDLIDDVLAQTRARLAAAKPANAAAVRAVPHALAGFSAGMLAEVAGAQGISLRPHVPASPGHRVR